MPLILEPADVQEAPYQGRVGATRVDNVHVPLPDGTLRSVTIHRAVNVGTDPHLRDVVLSGALHRLEGGIELAVPFVYHDPAARKMALVVPEGLRHEELRERARLLEMIANETTVPVPRYVGDATTVIGIEGLREYLGRGPAGTANAQADAELAARRRDVGTREEVLAQREQQIMAHEQTLATREQMLLQREQSLAQREQRMRERAEDVTRREDELAGLAEEHEAAQRDLAMREQELAQRLESLIQRERQLIERERQLAERERQLAERERRLADRSGDVEQREDEGARALTSRAPRELSSRSPAPAPASSIAAALGDALAVMHPVADAALEEIADDDDVVEELDELEPIRTHPGTDAARLGMDVPGPGASRAELGGADVEEIGDDDVEEEVDDADLTPDDGDGSRTQIARTHEIGVPETHPGPARPAELRGDVEMVARVGDGVELFVALGERSDAFARDVDLLIQLVVIEGTPVVLLSLVDASGGKPFVRRAALDVGTPAHRRVLESLRRRFEARVAFYGEGGELLRVGRVSAPRELNAARILDRVARLSGGIDAATAIERALAAPPPVAGKHPFVDDESGRFEDLARVAAALAELAEWASPEKMDHAMLVLSVPRDTIDATLARVLERAVEYGIAIPASLLDRALAAGIASDAAELVSKQIQAFRATLALEGAGVLDDEMIATNWERLLAAAADHEVVIDSETHDQAWRAIRAVRGEQTGSIIGGSIDPARIAQMGAPELVMLLEHPRYRRAAAIALCERGDPQFSDTLCKAIRKMPRAEVVRVVPRLIKLGDEAGDALIDGLSARKTFVRQAFALALGQLRLRRAVVPLLHLLGSEPTDVWREIARIVGSFGNAAVRTLSQKLADPRAPEDRYVLALAHLANHGCEKQVEAMTGDRDGRVAAMAVRALALREDARMQEDVVLGKRPLEGADPVVAFSRRFHEELEGTAPDADLAVVPGEEA